MIDLCNGMFLYHGSYVEVKEPLIEKCAKYKDFGRGFYLTSSRQQAVRFAKLSASKAIAMGKISSTQNYGIVSKYLLGDISKLKLYVYERADRKWLHCIVGHRKKNTFNRLINEMSDYDIIGGKIANDFTNATINAYMSNTFGKIGSDKADEICIELLLPNNLEDQFCFRTISALQSLSFLESDTVWMKK